MSFKKGLMGFRRKKNLDTHGWEWQQSRTDYPKEAKSLGHRRSEQKKFSALTYQFRVKIQAYDRLIANDFPLTHGRIKHLNKQVGILASRIKELAHASLLEGYEEEAGCAASAA